MTTITTLPRQAVDQELDLIIQRITANLVIEQIFCYEYTIREQPIKQLYILLSEGVSQGIMHSRALCEVTLENKPAFRCHVSYPSDVNRKIKQGNIRATLMCHPENMVYENPALKSPVIIPEINYAEWYESAIIFFNKESSRITAFEEGYSFYLNKENYSQASFMLHQVIELGYRAAENIIMGKEKISHSLRQHQNYILPFCPELGNLFDKQNERAVLEKLDEAYKAARYDHDFALSKEDLFIAYAKSKELITFIISCNNELLAEIQFQQKFEKELEVAIRLDETSVPVLVDMPSIVVTPTTTIQETIIEKIGTIVTPLAVYCFSHLSRSETRSQQLLDLQQNDQIFNRYYLVVIHDQYVDNPIHINQSINQMLPQETEVLIEFFNKAQFAKRLPADETFFQTVLDSADLWYGDVSDLKSEMIIQTSVNVANLRSSQRIIRNANNLIAAAEQGIGTSSEESCAMLLGISIEQLCLGLLKVLIDYRPVQYNLMHLIKLTEAVSPLAYQSLCVMVPEERDKIKVLNNALQQFRFNSRYVVDDSDHYVLVDRARIFAQKLADIIENHFANVAPNG